MVKITNGVNVFEVTRGAFDGIYSRQGYTIVNEKTAVDAVLRVVAAVNEIHNTAQHAPEAPKTPKIPEKTKDEIFVEEILEKPISQWNKGEIKRFVAIKKIDISGTKNANEAKEIIKSFIDGK